MSAYSTHCTEQISCIQTQRSFCCAACRRTVPATALRPFALGTHSTTLSRHVFLPQGRTQKDYRAASFSARTHPSFIRPASSTQLTLFSPASPRSYSCSALRPDAARLHCTCVRTHFSLTVPACLRSWIDSRLQEQPRQSDLQF